MPTNTEPERVRANTDSQINWRIDQQIEQNVRRYSGKPPEEIDRRIWQLEREWDIERVLETMAASFSLTGIALSITVDRRWILLPGVVLSFLLLHALEARNRFLLLQASRLAMPTRQQNLNGAI
jgi:hypothetical protein